MLFRCPEKDFQDPEAEKVYLYGTVYNHPNAKLEDGMPIVTTEIASFKAGDKKAKTLNTEYTLGEINKDFIDWMKANNIKLEDYERDSN